MKLTLRTLLAYLDDRLSPGNARELGQKLATSPFATELADRIKSVVRRRRLASESAEHKTIDGNLIAEYLDDQLTPELVALIEKEILSSDHSLAEVAATHQILGLLSDPVEISADLKTRLHKLDPSVVKEATDDGAAASTVQPARAGEWTPLQKQNESQKRSPMLLLAVMVLGWLGLLATDSNLFRGGDDRTVATNVPADGNEPALPQFDDGADPPQVAAPETQPAAGDAAVAQTDAIPANAAQATSPQPSTVPNGGAAATNAEPGRTPTPAGADMAATTQPATNPAAVPATDSTAPDKPMEPAPAADSSTATGDASVASAADGAPVATPTPPAAPVARFELIDNNGMVALREPKQAAWAWASSLGISPTGSWSKPLSETFATIAEPFTARVVAPNSGWSAQLLGPAVFQAVTEPAAALRVVEGRLLLRRSAKEGAAGFRLVTGRRALNVSIPDEGDVVGLEVAILPASNLTVEPDAEESTPLFPAENNRVIRIAAADGDVQVSVDGNDTPITIPRGAEWIWNTTSDVVTAGAVTVNSAIPAWLFAARNPPIEMQATLIAETVAAYPKSESVTGAAMALTTNKNPQIADYGVRQLTLLRSVNDLITVMLQTNDDPTRQSAIVGLHQLVQQRPADMQRIRDALAMRLPEMELDNAMTMLQGMSRSDGQDPRTSEFLVSMLEHNRAALRAMAIFNLERLTGERRGFFVSDDTGRRDAAVRRWKRDLAKNDGRLIPASAE